MFIPGSNNGVNILSGVAPGMARGNPVILTTNSFGSTCGIGSCGFGHVSKRRVKRSKRRRSIKKSKRRSKRTKSSRRSKVHKKRMNSSFGTKNKIKPPSKTPPKKPIYQPNMSPSNIPPPPR